MDNSWGVRCYKRREGGVAELSGCVVVLWRKQRCKIRREGGEGEDEEEEEQWVRTAANMHRQREHAARSDSH